MCESRLCILYLSRSDSEDGEDAKESEDVILFGENLPGEPHNSIELSSSDEDSTGGEDEALAG